MKIAPNSFRRLAILCTITMTVEGEFFFEGPDFNFDFAINDALMLNLYSDRISVFKIASSSGHAATTEALKIAL